MQQSSRMLCSFGGLMYSTWFSSYSVSCCCYSSSTSIARQPDDLHVAAGILCAHLWQSKQSCSFAIHHDLEVYLVALLHQVKWNQHTNQMTGLQTISRLQLGYLQWCKKVADIKSKGFGLHHHTTLCTTNTGLPGHLCLTGQHTWQPLSRSSFLVFPVL